MKKFLMMLAMVILTTGLIYAAEGVTDVEEEKIIQIVNESQNNSLQAPGKNKGARMEKFLEKHPEMKTQIMEKFDADKNGELSQEEKQAAKKEWKSMRKEGKGKSGKGHGQKGMRQRFLQNMDDETKKEFIAKYDADKDGKLSDEERKIAREATHKEMLTKFDKDGDGKLSEQERTARREEMKKKIQSKFDKDGDGQLSEEERKEMRKSRKGNGRGKKQGCSQCEHCKQLKKTDK